jgi:hypothetical protein
MSDDAKPLSAEEIAAITERFEWLGPCLDLPIERLLATLRARDEEIASLRAAREKASDHMAEAKVRGADRPTGPFVAELRKLASGAIETPPDHDSRAACRQKLINEGRCMANNDGECDWSECPQLRNIQPSCPRYEETRRRLDAEDDGR